MSEENLYPHCRPQELEPYYSQHVAVLTSEELNPMSSGTLSKLDVALRLAARDKQVADLRTQLESALKAIEFAAKRDLEQHEQIERLEAELESATTRGRELVQEAEMDAHQAEKRAESLVAAVKGTERYGREVEKRETDLLEALLWVAGNADFDFGDQFVEVWNSESSWRVEHDGTAEGFRAAILEAISQAREHVE